MTNVVLNKMEENGMTDHDATEVAYKNGYKAGYEAGLKAAKATGEWTEKYDKYAPPFFKLRWVCSACGEYSLYGKSKFCPECGAKMEVEE